MRQNDIKALAMELPEDILKAKWGGDFDRADRLIGIYLENPKVPECVKLRLKVEREILEELPLDYGYTMEEALAIVKEDIPDFTMEELDQLIDQGKIDWMYVGGKLHTATRFYETLLKVQPDIARRAGKIEDSLEETPGAKIKNGGVKEMQEKGVMARHIRIRAELKINEDAFRKEEILVHLPIPKPQINMKNIRVLKTYPENSDTCKVEIGEESQGQRTVSFREVMTENHPFCVEYEYDSVAMYHDVTGDMEKGIFPAPCEDKEGYLPEDLQEVYPHIRFSPTIMALRDEIADGETDPLKLARRFYDYATTNVTYSFMRQYFTMEEIPEYVGLGLKGDCGVQALLFITLCRASGIPARWQSGLHVTPEVPGQEADAGMHDWAMFYAEPYGWLFADPSFGGSSYRNGNLESWNHYFGNLDACRMAANDRFQANLIPDKEFSRQDPYDNQVGEAEYVSGGLRKKDLDRPRTVLEFSEI